MINEIGMQALINKHLAAFAGMDAEASEKYKRILINLKEEAKRLAMPIIEDCIDLDLAWISSWVNPSFKAMNPLNKTTVEPAIQMVAFVSEYQAFVQADPRYVKSSIKNNKKPSLNQVTLWYGDRLNKQLDDYLAGKGMDFAYHRLDDALCEQVLAVIEKVEPSFYLLSNEEIVKRRNDKANEQVDREAKVAASVVYSSTYDPLVNNSLFNHAFATIGSVVADTCVRITHALDTEYTDKIGFAQKHLQTLKSLVTEGKATYQDLANLRQEFKMHADYLQSLPEFREVRHYRPFFNTLANLLNKLCYVFKSQAYRALNEGARKMNQHFETAEKSEQSSYGLFATDCKRYQEKRAAIVAMPARPVLGGA